jgi:hypothetical protein
VSRHHFATPALLNAVSLQIDRDAQDRRAYRGNEDLLLIGLLFLGAAACVMALVIR